MALAAREVLMSLLVCLQHSKTRRVDTKSCGLIIVIATAHAVRFASQGQYQFSALMQDINNNCCYVQERRYMTHGRSVCRADSPNQHGGGLIRKIKIEMAE